MTSWISIRTGQFVYFDRQLGYPDWTGKKVLDFAGNVGNILLDPNCKIEPANYWSIDVSRDAITEGKKRHPEAHFVFYDRYNFEFNPTGTVGLPIPDQGVKFDYVIGWSIFTHVSKDETLELADQILDMMTDKGKAAFTFLDPLFTPPVGWVRDSESPGLSNLARRLEARSEVKPEMDVAGLMNRAMATQMDWVTLLNEDDLIFGPDEDGISTDKPNRAYCTFCTHEYMCLLFPKGQILHPVPPERQSCVIFDKASRR